MPMFAAGRYPGVHWRLDEPNVDSLFLPPHHLAVEARSALGNEGEFIGAFARGLNLNASTAGRPIDHDAAQQVRGATDCEGGAASRVNRCSTESSFVLASRS